MSNKRLHNCLGCGKEFFQYPSIGQRFCSRRCSSQRHEMGRESRFFDKVLKTDSCWLWKGGLGASGYGSFNRKPKYLAHRYSYEIHKGKIPKGMWVLHTCDNKKCVNPKHLFLGTLQDNVDDMVKKNRQSMGEKRHNVKLNNKKVIEIREKYSLGVSLAKLAREFNVTIQCINLVVKRINWKQI